MPYHLWPTTRREFLRRCVAAGAAAIAPRAWAADLAAATARKDPDPNCFALLSDVHIDAEISKTDCGGCMSERFAQAIEEVLDMDVRPAGMIIAGDCVHLKGRDEDYCQFAYMIRDVLDARLPLHLVMGNHDNRKALYRVLEQFAPPELPVRDKHVSIVPTRYVNWFLLDSLNKTDHAEGLFGSKQLAWLAGALDAHADKPAVLMAHHHPNLTGEMALEKRKIAKGLKDTQPFLDLIAGRRQVKAYIYGHRHRWMQNLYEGVHLVGLPATGYVFSSKDPYGWVRAQLDPEGMAMELHSLNPKHPADGQVVQLRWRS